MELLKKILSKGADTVKWIAFVIVVLETVQEAHDKLKAKLAEIEQKENPKTVDDGTKLS
jgi:hypothetical protein